MKEKIKQLIKETGISEIENILKELKSETSCYKSHDNPLEGVGNDFKSKKCLYDNIQAARDWFHNYLKGVLIYKKEEYPESLFFKDGDNNTIMEQNYKNNRLWLSWFKIWAVLESKYELNEKEIKNLIQDLVSNTFKIKVGTPLIRNLGHILY